MRTLATILVIALPACTLPGNVQHLSSHLCETEDYYDLANFGSKVTATSPPNPNEVLPGTHGLLFEAWAPAGQPPTNGSAEITGGLSMYTGIYLKQAKANSTRVGVSHTLVTLQKIQGPYAFVVGDAPLVEVNDLTDLHLQSYPQFGRPDARVYVRESGEFVAIQVAGLFDEVEVGGVETMLAFMCSRSYPVLAASPLSPHLLSGKAKPTVTDWHGYQFEVIGPDDREVTSVRIGEPDQHSPSILFYETPGLEYAGTTNAVFTVHLYEYDSATGLSGLVSGVKNIGPLGTPQTPSTPVDVPIAKTLQPGKSYVILFTASGMMANESVRARFGWVDHTFFPYPSGDGLYEIQRAIQVSDPADLPTVLSQAPSTENALAPWIRLDSSQP